LYVQTAEQTDFQNVSGISFLPANFTIDEDNFSCITENSLVVLDDFSFKLANNKQAKINFLKVVNYILLTFLIICLINVDFPLLNSTEKIYSLPIRHEKDTFKIILTYYYYIYYLT
jgi:hypothetical protein